MLSVAETYETHELNAVVASCNDALLHGFTYADVKRLTAQATPLLATAEEPALALLVGALLTGCGEWNRASALLTEQARRFQSDPLVAYEAALVSIDANQHARARDMFVQLSTHLPDLSLRHLRGVWRGCSMIGMFDLSLAAISIATAQDPSFVPPHVTERIRTALSVQTGLDNPPIRLISIGDNCLPWMVGNRWGLRTDPTAEHERSVFNLAQCSPESVSNLLASRCRALLDPSELRSFTTEIGTPLPYHAPSGFQFNHEQGDIWCENDFERLREKYTSAVTNMGAAFSNGPRVFLHYREKSGDMARLADAIAENSENDAYRILVIDPNVDSIEPEPHPKTTYRRIELPFAEYVWFKPDHLESVEGIEFERKIVAAVLEEMKLLRL